MAFIRDPEEKSEKDVRRLTQLIEERTSQLSTGGYVGLALGSLALSGFLAFGARKSAAANFVGFWAPTILLMGLYNKLVKIEEELGATRH